MWSHIISQFLPLTRMFKFLMRRAPKQLNISITEANVICSITINDVLNKDNQPE